MVTSIDFLDVEYTTRPGAFLGQLPDGLETGSFLSPLVSLLTAGRTVLKFLARLAFMPCVLMNDTDLVATCHARKYVAFHTTEVDLPRVAGATPPKVGCKHS
jgi:hypothetical protein